MRKYIAIFRIRFSNSLQYRAAALAGVSTQFAWGFMEILALRAFYRANPAAYPMEFSQSVAYIWLQQAFLALFMSWLFEAEIFESITTGSIAYELSRPIDLYNRWFCQSVANRLSKAVLRCFPVLIVAFILPEPFRLRLPLNGAQFLLFLISACLGLCVVVSFSMLIYISAFYTLSSRGVRAVSSAVVEFLSGAIIPLPFFPESLRKIVEILPFAAMQNMPLRIYSGNISGTEAFYGIALQIIWLVFLTVAGKLFMKNALTRVVVQGG